MGTFKFVARHRDLHKRPILPLISGALPGSINNFNQISSIHSYIKKGDIPPDWSDGSWIHIEGAEYDWRTGRNYLWIPATLRIDSGELVERGGRDAGLQDYGTLFTSFLKTYFGQE